MLVTGSPDEIVGVYRDVFEHPEARHAGGGVNGRGGAHRPVAVVRYHRAVVGLRQRRDLAQLVHPARVDCVGLDVVAAVLLQQLAELETGSASQSRPSSTAWQATAPSANTSGSGRVSLHRLLA